ncbi:MAG: alanine racemase [Gemmatimonadaceae bacterium]|nr:alanine racemase [Gemmatimonadaceae bacterium]
MQHNAMALQERARRPLVAMVKADAYGVGMLPVVRALGGTFKGTDAVVAPGPDVWAFGVATLDEAATLRHAGCLNRILCTAPLTMRDFPEARALDVRPALHRGEDIMTWAALGGGAWHFAIDTGMSRAGVPWNEVKALRTVLGEHQPEGIFTHFHSAEREDGSRALQESRFDEAVRALRPALHQTVLQHLDNSAGIASRDAHGSPGALVRPGIGLYGSTVTEALTLAQVVHVRARIIDLREIAAGESVSYGATWRADTPRRIATVALGYADGYRRALSNRGWAIVRGQRVPVVGNVTMDMTMLDVTTLSGGCSLGDIATLVGTDGDDTLSTDDVASWAEMSPYELLTGLRLRLPRRYFDQAGDDDSPWSTERA